MSAELPEPPYSTRLQDFLGVIAGVPGVELPDPPYPTVVEQLLYEIATNGGGGGTSNYEQLSNLPKVNGITIIGNKAASDLDLQKGIKRIVITSAMVIAENPVKIQLTDEMDTIMRDLDTPYVILDGSAVGLGSTVFYKVEARTPHYWLLVQIAGNFQSDTQSLTEATIQSVVYSDTTKIGVYQETAVIRKEDIANSVGSSTEKPVSQKLFTDTVGDIETLMDNLISGGGAES